MGKGTLEFVQNALNGWLRPKLLGESWDNIGLLVGSGRYAASEKPVNSILLCNDLTTKVVNEAITKKVDLIIAYHPPIFAALKAVGYGSWKEQIVAKCLAYDIAIYSPHTTLDAVVGGINDRIMDYFRGDLEQSEVSLETITTAHVDKSCKGIEYESTAENISLLYSSVPFGDISTVSFGFDVKNLVNGNGNKATLLVYPLKETSVEGLEQVQELAKALNIPDFSSAAEARPGAVGGGRILRFRRPIAVDNIVERLRACTGVQKIKFAQGPKTEIQSIALCVGSGASILKGLQVDAVVTGEMTHHDVLDCLEAQQTVILCGHADSERHYLSTLREIVKIITLCPNVYVSEADQSLFRFV